MKQFIVLTIILIGLAGFWYFSKGAPSEKGSDQDFYLWLVEVDDIHRIQINLVRQRKSITFIKVPSKNGFPWLFDDSNRSSVDPNRWGGGIPLLLSGPRVERLICGKASDKKLMEYGLLIPNLRVILGLKGGEVLKINVGDKSPDGHAYYIQSPDSRKVALVSDIWFTVISGLVELPPYVRNDEK